MEKFQKQIMQLTPNRRLAIFLQRQNPRAQVCAFAQWYTQLWKQYQTQSPNLLPEILSPYAESLLWESIVTEIARDRWLLRIPQTAQLLKEAHALTRQWQLDPLQYFAHNEESIFFVEGLQAFERKIKELNKLDTTGVLQNLCEVIPECRPFLPAHLECIGFYEWTPLQKHFLECLEKSNITVSFNTLLQDQDNEVRIQAFETSEGELLAAAKKISDWYLQNKQANIGLIVLDLAQRREEIQNILQENLPEACFNIAAPCALSEHPIIAAKMLALSMVFKEISLENLSRMLRSPFFKGGIENQSVLAMFDVYLHEHKNPKTTLFEVLQLFKQLQARMPEAQSELMCSFEKVVLLRDLFKGKKMASEWITHSQLWLETLGFGGGRPLNTAEISIKEKGEGLWAEYLALESFLGPHTFKQALGHIQRLADMQQFTPATHTDAPIQVLGLLEALGLPFDKLWVLGLTQDVWPRPPNPNPFIPMNLQWRYELPRSSPVRELQMAKLFTQAICRGAFQVMFSYPTQALDHPQKISALLKEFPEEAMTVSDIASPAQQYLENTAHIAEMGSQYTGLKGSITALKLQALCPFRAFAEVRLKAEKIQKPSRTLLKSERGEIVHEVLYLFWKEIQNSDRLQSLSQEQLTEIVGTVIEHVLADWQKKFPRRLTATYINVEKQRLQRLILEFLILEKSRPPFEVVALEQPFQIKRFPLHFNLRMDRIDQLMNGEKIIIDYKTGLVQLSALFKDPILEPQLPLYCMNQPSEISGLSFVLLKSNEIKYQGISKHSTGISGIKPLENWDLQLETWQQSISKLIQDFMAGKADVSPILGESTCRNCHLHRFCRVGFNN